MMAATIAVLRLDPGDGHPPDHHLRDRIQIVIYAYETGIIRPAPDATPP